MADITTSTRSNVVSGRRRKPHRFTPRIDFTPMVDLGFLLITFFMLTTSLNKPNLMSVVMPKTDKQTSNVKSSQVLTLIAGNNNQIYWYEGIENPVLDSCDYSSSGLRHIILDKKSRVDAQEQDGADTEQASKINILIKCTDGSTFQNLVDILDEMKICNIGFYTIMPLTPAEQAFIQHPENGLHLTEADQKAALKNGKL